MGGTQYFVVVVVSVSFSLPLDNGTGEYKIKYLKQFISLAMETKHILSIYNNIDLLIR